MKNGVSDIKYSNVASTQGPFTLRGGCYGMTVIGTGFGTVTLNKLAADGSTYVSTGISFAANGYQSGNLPSGTYQIAIATTTAVYAEITSIVEDQ
jgi:hypothetical protein